MTELLRTFGCVRKVWNLALDARTSAWYQRQERVSYVQSSAMLTEWKKTDDLAYLNEVSSVPLQQALPHLQGAFAAFWDKRARYPRFKSRRSRRGARQSAEYTRSAFRYRDGRVFLAKMSEPLDIRWSRPLPEGAEPSTVTVSRDAAGRWFVSLLAEETIRQHPATGAVVGIDAGITSLLTLSTGEKVANPRHERRDRQRLAKAQRELARKVKGSANREKARRKVARVHARIADRRADFLHKLSTRIIRENQAVAIEDLSVRSMLRNHSLARAISDASWSKFRRMLEYKAEWHGRTVIAVDRWYPSSKTCSACGATAAKMRLSVREWECASCGIWASGPSGTDLRLLTAQPAVDVEAQRLTGRHRAQAVLDRGHPLGAEQAGPAVADVLEGLGGQRQRLGAPGGEPDQLAPPVGRLAAALRVPELDQPVDGLAGRLLGHAEAAPDVRRGGAEDPDGLHREPVRGAQSRVPAGRELLVRLVDHRAEPGQQQQRQLVPGTAASRSAVAWRDRQLVYPPLIGNLVN